MPVIVDGREYDLQGVTVYNWKTHPKECPKTPHVNPRRTFVRGIVLHTVHGTADGGVVDTHDESKADLAYAKYQSTTKREVSWHFTVDVDGSIAQSADPVRDVCWHATQTNPFTIGIELVQAPQGDLTRIQLDAMVRLIDFLTRVDVSMMAIQRQIPMRGGQHYRGIISRTLTEFGSGASVNGIYGHRNIWYRSKTGALKPYRGAGDPGDAPFEALFRAGYEAIDFESAQDRSIWSDRQRALGIKVDGIPGPATKAAIRAAGFSSGTYVRRPGD
jgi:hypothetical protein